MKRILPRFQTAILSTATGVALLWSVAANTAAAADKTWDGEGANDFWQTAANWDPSGGGGTAPVANDFLIFDGATRLTPNNNFTAGTIFNNLAFGAGASSFTLGGNGITLTNVGNAGAGTTSGGSINNSSPNAQTVNLPVTLTAGKHNLVADGGGQLNLSGAVTRNTGAVGVFTTSSGSINVTGSGMANANGILGGWATLGNDWAALDASSNVVAYASYTDISAGAVASDATSNVRLVSDTGHLSAAAGVTINSFLATIGAARNLTNLGTTKLGPNGGIYRTAGSTANSVMTVLGGTLTANGGGEITLSDATAGTGFAGTANNLQVTTTVITNDGANPVSVNIMGYVAVSAANTYSGGTYINQGRAQTGNPAALGTGPVYVYPGGQAFLNNGTTYANTFFISGIGTTESGGLGAIRAAGRNITNVVTLMGDAAIGCGNNGTIANNRITGKITGPGGLIIGNGSNNNGGGTLTVGTAGVTNDYAGNTLISSNTARASALTFTAGANNVMPHGSGKGDVILNGTNQSATLDLNGTTQNINGLNSAGSAPANTFVSSTVAGGLLVLGNNNVNSAFAGTVQNGAGNLGITKVGSGTHTFTGPLTYTNNTTVDGGTLILAGSSVPPSPVITVNSNATLNVSAICPVTLGAAQTLSMSNGTVVVALQASGNAITTPTLTSLGSTNFVSITSIPSISAYPAQFVAIKYTNTLNGALNFGLSGALPVSPGTPFAGYISNNTANGSVDFVVTAGPSSIKWVGYSSGAPNSSWDLGTANWATIGGAPTTYADGSFARFDDTASNGVVSLDIIASPAGITATNSALTYTIGGGNYISGGGGLTKQGAGTLILDHSGVNDFTGGVTISGGTLQIGINDAGGNLPVGSVVDNAALVFSRNDSVTVPNVISGTGTVSQNGSGSLLLTAANTFTGAVSVLQGTLQAGNNAALGTTNGSTTVAINATLDITANAINLGQEQITISGPGVVGGGGALINSAALGAFVGPNAARVTLSGDTTVGGSGRFDLRSATTSNPLLGSLSTLGQPRKLTKVGGGTFGLIGITVDPALGDIEVQQGILGLQDALTGLGNVLSNLTIWPGATLQMFAVTNLVNKVITLGGDGATTTVSATSGTGNTIIGPMSITNDCIFNVGGATVALALNNVITGPGKITKIGAGLLTLSGNSPSYAGGLQLNNGGVTLSGTLSNSVGITVSAGTFTLNGTLLGAGLTSVASTTVAGGGTAAGPADVSGYVFPGETNVVGTLTVGGLTLQSGAALFYDLTATTTPGTGTNDLIVVNGDLTVNGNAVTISPIGLLKTGAGNPYRLFNYTGNLIWNADLTVTAPFNYTFAVDTNTVGQVNILVSGGPPVWDGGSPTTSNWTDSTNWSELPIVSGDSLFFNGPARLSNNNDTAADTTYTDINFIAGAGAFTLNGNPITLAGNIINNSTNTQTVNLGLSSSVNNTFNGAAGTLIIGGGVTNTATTTTTLSLAGTGILTNQLYNTGGNVTNILSISSNAPANWTLMDNPSSIALTNPVQLDVLAGTFNFGTGSSAPKLVSTTLANSRVGVAGGIPATFNMAGGTLTIAARLNTGAAGNAIATINQTGGTINIEDIFQGADGAATVASTVNVSGGLFNVGETEASPNTFFLCSRGTGTVTVATSGQLHCGTFDVSRNIGVTVGTVNLNAGGTLRASRVGTATGSANTTQNGSTAIFNFNGGTLRARASSATFFQGATASPSLPITAIVKSGGAIVDSDTNAISILEPLVHDSALGATADGGLTKLGVGTLTLTAASTYNGNTVISNGTLAVNGSLGVTAVTVGSGGTLAGTGTLGSNVTVNVGGTMSPGNAAVLGLLTVVSNVTLNGTTAMDLNQSTATNDVLRAATINYGGTLTVTNLAGTLAGGQSYKLFSGTLVGNFATTNLPPLAGGLSWDWNPTTGILSVLGSSVNTTPTNIISSAAGGNLTLTWPGDHLGWTLQVQTNSRSVGLTMPTNTWFDVSGSTTTNQMVMPIGPTEPTVFYRLRLFLP